MFSYYRHCEARSNLKALEIASYLAMTRFVKNNKPSRNNGMAYYMSAFKAYNLSFALTQFKSSKATFKRATKASSDLRNQTRGS